MFVADYMVRSVVTVCETDLLVDADQRLKRSAFHQFPVLDSAGRLTGILTDRDIRSTIGFDGHAQEALTVAEAMTSNPQTIALEASLDEAVRTFARRRFNALPVVHHGDLVGIITVHDLLRAFGQTLGLDREGTRIEVALPNMGEDLAYAFKALEPFAGELVSAAVCSMRRDGVEPTLYLRIANGRSAKAEAALRHAGLIVLVPETP